MRNEPERSTLPAMEPNGSHHCRVGRASRQAAPNGAGREARARHATPTYALVGRNRRIAGFACVPGDLPGRACV